MKRLFLGIIGLAGVYIIVQGQQRAFSQKLLEKRFGKNADATTGPVPDYSQMYYWAASPYKHDSSDSIPAFLKEETRDTGADVFYIHPTSFTSNMKTSAWNADLSDTAVNHQTDMRSILFQASVFNGSCRVYAPRYRQAHLKAFVVKNSDNAKHAFDLAYSDVKKAFQYYLDHENHGRPVIIASHSQGSLHAIRLLQEFFDGKPLQKQLVCAYIIGWPLEMGMFKYIPVGDSASATGCVVGWCSYKNGELPRFLKAENGNGICVNPLTWTTAGQWASPDMNLGAIFRDFSTLHPHAAGAGVDTATGILWVSLAGEWDIRAKKAKNLHIVDYNLFWMNIRENVKLRTETYLKEKELFLKI